MTASSLSDRLDERWACRQRAIYGRHAWLVSWRPATEEDPRDDAHAELLWLARVSCPESPDTAEGLGATRRAAIVAADRALRIMIEEDQEAVDSAYSP
jgi:hypothetical protein